MNGTIVLKVVIKLSKKGEPLLKKVVITNLKGGVAKTTNTFNIASVLSEKHKVLVVDIDPQCSITGDFRIDYTNQELPSAAMIFNNDIKNQPSADDVIIKHPFPELPNLDIIPNSTLMFLSEMILAAKAARERVLESFFRRNEKVLNKYDYVFFDTQPLMSIININAFYLADSIIFTSDTSRESLEGAELFDSIWSQNRDILMKEDNVRAMFICRANVSRDAQSRDILDYVHTEDFPMHEIVTKTYIPFSAKIGKTGLLRTPINVLFKKDPIKKRYETLIAELKEMEAL